MKSQLLPEGFRDRLPEIAELENQINSFFLELMKFNGFMIVKPPLVEFENSLFFLTNESDNINTFRVMDPLTQKIMGIRSDITMQVARMACGSLSEIKRPLRLCYTGEVLKVKNNNINLSRQFTQIGSEIIGVEKDYCLDEIINLIIEILNKLKIKKFIINFSIPNLINLIAEDFKLNKSDYATLVNSFKNKNIEKIKDISTNLFEMSEYLMGGIGKIEMKGEYLKKYNFQKNIKREIINFVDQIRKIKKHFNDYEILIDPLEVDESNYHDGFCFKIYSDNSKELFTGGGYKVGDDCCVGFSGFLENLILDSKIRAIKKKKIFVENKLDFKKIKSFQQKNKMIVIKAVKEFNKTELIREAKTHNCDFYFYKNSIYKVK